MGIMGRLAKLDSAMQRGLDNGMAFVFGGRVVPAEIEELLKQEAQDNLTRGDDGLLYGPNVVTVAVSSKDIENLSKDSDLPELLADQLGRFMRNKGWALAGPVIVRIAEESGLRTGQLRVSSFIDHEPGEETGYDAIFHEPTTQEGDSQEDEMTDQYNNPEAATTAFRAARMPDNPGSGPSVNLLLQDGSSRTYQVHEGSNIIGRSTDADLRLPDTGVSRQHAEITWNGQDAVLVDLQSTNGTTVNDTPIENWLLADGDVITMGHSHIEVRITGLDN
ncbi:DUF3662 and FHA domain-containing protein [Corynebacterium phoceense]|uniref:DUF3662 and FHA domain-containing protein n=1 Tax=Corynebacterium TaxID=1716 RepID=UPI00211CBF40|nr:DUF3662 and FHA domain-containing protein [Corynebacterium phoceense]MCQ9334368.1 DUF3662 and FHA domain-containing protein [Corynebacterium phoceense]MCQ9337421.1 DUF3662 and FHA domain-containing protein [Corynebacterium phoceense]